MNVTKVIWRGLSKSNRDVCLLASIGGNSKTSLVFELSLIPTAIIEAWDEYNADVDVRNQGVSYVHMLRALVLLVAVCPEACEFVQAGKGCYVQHNVQNARQVARIIRDIDSLPEPGLYMGALAGMLKVARILGVSKVRSMVAGDACMIPPGVWTKVERAILRRYALEFWLAYTHGWDGAPHLQATHVASVNSRDKALEARGMDWSVFEVLDVGAPMSSQSALCPGSKEFANKRGFKIGCGSCPMACNAGAAKKWRAVVTHGNGDASRKAAANRRGNNELMNERGQVKGLYVAA